MEVCGVGGGEKSALASELAQMQAMVRELGAHMDQQDLPAAVRELCGELCGELASSVDRSIRIARSCGLAGADSPGSRDGSPRSASDGTQHPAAAAGGNAQSKRSRKGTPCVRRQVRVASVDMAPLDDGISWRKYGQKDILGAKYPRAYFRCTHRHTQGCAATKHVQRAAGDPLLYDVVYHGAHTCAQAAHPGAEQLRQQLQLQPEPGHADAGQEQSSPPLALQETEGLQAGPEPMTPYWFGAPAPGDGADFPLLSPTGLEWQLRSMDHETQFEEFYTNAADPSQWDYQDLYATN
uniref:WRKY domain-containing protein n=1 Tax=Setaria viridis TaxID=4556 RepID=A0A4U6VD40_SETVI|nr:probable WRKY transcription factor 30 isoform X1 [Setaria viridis]TKW25783.1 hypothetical protein SEVIR_3G141700v2 [Setaria viridis]